MIQPIALRFKYHFQGSRNTNRVDKPEWAFTHILDQIYEHESFIEEYLGPLTHGAGYPVDVKVGWVIDVADNSRNSQDSSSQSSYPSCALGYRIFSTTRRYSHIPYTKRWYSTNQSVEMVSSRMA